MLIYFSLTLFVSATLLFLVQPMIGKMILPQLGGTPAVWNTCMVFFQAVLLFGYGYTHLLTTTQPPRRQLIIQGIMLLFPFLVLPFALDNWQPPTDSNPIFALICQLVLMVGLPFFAVSTTAPLLQKWFGHTGHPAAKDPYFLYGASNFGSMLGLAIYPTVIEPWLQVAPTENAPTICTQVHLWTLGFAIFVALVIGCAYLVWQILAQKPEMVLAPAGPAPSLTPAPTANSSTAIASSPRRRTVRLDAAPAALPVTQAETPIHNDHITFWRRLRWVGLAAAPSSLMLGVTTYMTTDIAAVAFFWILPLALYLLTFILVFAHWPMIFVNTISHGLGWKTSWPTEWTNIPHTIVMFLQPCFLLFLVLKMIANLSPPTWAEFLLHLAAFFSTALMCHGELAKDRPSTRYLTEFYFWMSLGGVLGGLFNALFAPIVFQHGIWEYPIAMAFACLLRSNLVEEVKTFIPGDSTAEKPTQVGYALDWAVPIAIGGLGFACAYLGDKLPHEELVLNRSLFLPFLGVIALGAVGGYYFSYADRTKFDLDTLISFVADRTYLRPFLILLFTIAVIFLVVKNPQYDVAFLMKRSYLLAVLVVIVLALSLRPLRFGLSVAALFIALGTYDRLHDALLYEGRGFFGLLRVRESKAEWYPLPVLHENERPNYEFKVYRTLIHGGINHGRQIVEYKETFTVLPSLAGSSVGLLGSPLGLGSFLVTGPWVPGELDTNLHYAPLKVTQDGYWSKELTLKKRREPITYFHESNGVAEVYRKFSWHDARLPASMVGLMGGPFSTLNMLVNTQSEPPYAVLGLGTGILAAYAKPYQAVHFYEIDPLVRNLSLPADSSDPVFWFLRDAKDRGAFLDVKMGDGRLKIKEAPDNYYHIISLDAFSSDAIPVHLLTAEAVELYMSKLAEGGVLIFNTTNRYVRIEGVLAAIAGAKGYECLYCPDYTYANDHPDRFSADWVVLQRKIDKDQYRNGGPPIGIRLEKSRKRLTWDGRPVRNEKGKEIIDDRWQLVEPLEGPIWTDTYSNLLNRKVLRWGW